MPAVLTLCSGCSSRNRELPYAGEVVERLYQEIDNSSLLLYDGSRKVWKLESAHMRKTMGDTGSIVGVPVKLTLYDSMGTARSAVLGDSGSTTTNKDQFVVWGNVFVRTDDSLIVKAERLTWAAKSHRVTSDDFVQIETPNGDVMRGKGLDADENFSWWNFRSNVSGVFPNFKERIEGDDGFGFGAPATSAGDST